MSRLPPESGVLAELLVHGVGEVPFERAEGVASGASLGAAALEVGAGSRVVASLGERHHVQGVVEAAVAAPVEPVALCLARAGGDGGGAVEAGEAGLAGDAADVADLTDDAGGAEVADPDQAGQAAAAGLHRLGDFALELLDLAVEAAQRVDPPPGELCLDAALARLGRRPGSSQALPTQRIGQTRSGQHRAGAPGSPFPRSRSRNIEMSSACPATTFFRRAFSCSSAFNRCASSSSRAPYLIRQRKKVWSLIPRRLHTCAIVCPYACSRSASPSLATICSTL